MLAMALLLRGGLLGGVGGEAGGVDGYGEGAWTLATPAEGFLAASGTGELAYLQYPCQFFRITHNLNTVALMMRISSTWALGQILHLRPCACRSPETTPERARALRTLLARGGRRRRRCVTALSARVQVC